MAEIPLMPMAGMNVVAEEAALQRGGDNPRVYVRDAVNVNVSPAGQPSLRAGTRRVTATGYRNLWQSPLHRDTFGTLGSQWVKIDPLSWTSEVLEDVGEGEVSHEVLNNVVCVAAPAGIFTFDGARGPLTEEDKTFLLLAARHSGQALERLRLFAAEQEGRVRAELLYGLARAVIGADRVELVFEAALDAIRLGLGADRAAILVLDSAGVMRFRSWRNLSDEYRRAVEGHSPWGRGAHDPQPVVVPDVETDASMAPFPTCSKPRFARSG